MKHLIGQPAPLSTLTNLYQHAADTLPEDQLVDLSWLTVSVTEELARWANELDMLSALVLQEGELQDSGAHVMGAYQTPAPLADLLESFAYRMRVQAAFLEIAEDASARLHRAAEQHATPAMGGTAK